MSSRAPSLAGQFPLTNQGSKPTGCIDDDLVFVTSSFRDPSDVVTALSRGYQMREVCTGSAADA